MPSNLVKEVLTIAHGNGHPGFKAYQNLLVLKTDEKKVLHTIRYQDWQNKLSSKAGLQSTWKMMKRPPRFEMRLVDIDIQSCLQAIQLHKE